jgi:hypothetical protein
MSVARVYRADSPYLAAELADLDYEQSADTMYLAHIAHQPEKLVRASHTNWGFSDLTFTPKIAAPTGASATPTTPNTDAANSGDAYFPEDARYVVTALDDDTGQESRASSIATATNDLGLKRNYTTIAWSAVTGADRYRVYKANGNGDFGYIGTTDQLNFVDDNIGPDLSDGPPQAQNPFPTSDDYPSTVGFFQQRLGWARTNNHPNAVYFSRAGEYENMDESRPLKASDALSFALLAGKVNAVNHLVSTRVLLALTSDSIFTIDGGADGFLSPSNVTTSRQNGRGSSRLKPLLIDNVTFYQPAIGTSVRTIGYELQSDGYDSNDITIFSPHMFRGFSIVSWTYAAEPLSVIWAVRNDGKLLAFTWQQEQQVWGWALCETDGFVESVTSISEQGEDRVYLSVVRGGIRLIERMASAYWANLNDACFLDSALTYDFETPSATLTNLEHLEGLDVVALADGAVVRDLTVSDGTVTLPDAVSNVTVGLPYTGTVETLPLAQQGSRGWTIGKPGQITKVAVRVVDSRGFLMGPSADKLVEPESRDHEVFGSPPDLVTGIVEAVMPPLIRSGRTRDAGVNVTIQSADPLPLTLTEVFYDPSVSE